MTRLDAVARRLAYRTLVGLGGARARRFLKGGEAVILTYHNVVPDGSAPGGDRSLHVSRSEFAAQLDVLLETHEVRPVEEILTAEELHARRPVAAITFDDGYRGALTLGVGELVARSLPVTCFVSPGLLGCDALWWDELGAGWDAGLPPDLREEALTDHRGAADAIRDWAEGRGLESAKQPGHVGVVTEEELDEVSRRPGVSLGSHTWSHPNLTLLSEEELREELERSLVWLRDRHGDATLSWLSVPYGLHDRRVLESALDVGYSGMLTLDNELVPGGSDRRAVPRVNVAAGLSLDRFRLRTAGW